MRKPETLRPAQAGAYAGVSPDTALRWARRHGIVLQPGGPKGSVYILAEPFRALCAAPAADALHALDTSSE